MKQYFFYEYIHVFLIKYISIPVIPISFAP
jgi:hypothetical protein